VSGNVDTSGINLHTTNGGETWLSEPSGTHWSLWSIAFPQANLGWAVGYYGVILHTTDGGGNWTQQDSGAAWGWGDVCFVDAGHGWAVGFDGKILHYEAPVSVPPSPSPLPLQTVLAPAYPNPFNPTTTLNYALAQSGLVTMKIFDLTGREVSTLVNNAQPSGTHSVIWNAAASPSGVYLCRLQTPTSSSTQKLLLVK
jgi:hypothetical protein